MLGHNVTYNNILCNMKLYVCEEGKKNEGARVRSI